MRSSFRLLCLVASLSGASASSAAVLTTSQTIPDPLLDPFFPIIGTFDILGSGEVFEDRFTAAFDPFDTSLGTLIGARLSYVTGIGSFGDVQTTTLDPGSYSASLSTRLESSAFSTGVIASDMDSIPSTPLADFATINLLVELNGGIDATDLSPFTGPDPIFATLFNGYDFRATDAEFLALADQFAELTLTYTYDTSPPPVVPLPAGGVLLLSGLIGFGAVRRRQS